VGGCQVALEVDRWPGTKPAKTTKGESVFGLIPTECTGPEGLLLRDPRYAESSPELGTFRMTTADGPAASPPPRDAEVRLSGSGSPPPDREGCAHSTVEGSQHGPLPASKAAAAQSHPPLARGQRPRAFPDLAASPCRPLAGEPRTLGL